LVLLLIIIKVKDKHVVSVSTDEWVCSYQRFKLDAKQNKKKQERNRLLTLELLAQLAVVLLIFIVASCYCLRFLNFIGPNKNGLVSEIPTDPDEI